MAALNIRLSIIDRVYFYYITINQLQLTINILSVEIKCVYLPPDINLVLLFCLNLKAMEILIKGIKEKDFIIDQKDSLAIKLSMLIEGHCTIGVYESIKKYGYTEQRYYQLLEKYHKEGTQGLIDKKTGSDKKPVRTKQIVNQIIRLRFLDPFASATVLAQKLSQLGFKVSIRSVERTITEFGLKKNACTEPRKREETKRNRNTNI